MSSREEFEKEMCNEYLWFGEALELAHFHGDDATGYYTGGGYIYEGTSCAEALFWAWRGWQASKTKAQSQLTALTSQLESVVAENAALKAICEDRRQFILNGVEMGFIRLPDKDIKDPAKATYERCLSGMQAAPCQKCNDTGMTDSGGTQPWGEPIEIECDCGAYQLRQGGAA